MTAFDEVLTEAIETYNRYRSPMATAELVDRGDDSFRVRFEGPFCTTCCRDDYFEDLVYELKELGVEVSAIGVDAIEQTGLERFVVDYSVERPARRVRS